jgi:hypothetical protein
MICCLCLIEAIFSLVQLSDILRVSSCEIGIENEGFCIMSRGSCDRFQRGGLYG